MGLAAGPLKVVRRVTLMKGPLGCKGVTPPLGREGQDGGQPIPPLRHGGNLHRRTRNRRSARWPLAGISSPPKGPLPAPPGPARRGRPGPDRRAPQCLRQVKDGRRRSGPGPAVGCRARGATSPRWRHRGDHAPGHCGHPVLVRPPAGAQMSQFPGGAAGAGRRASGSRPGLPALGGAPIALICKRRGLCRHAPVGVPNQAVLFSRLRRIWLRQAIPCLSCRPGEAGAGCPCRGGTGRQVSRSILSGFPAALSRSCRG